MSEIKAFSVVNKNGCVENIFEFFRSDAQKAADALAAEYPEYGPYSVIELTGQLPRKPEKRTVWCVVDNKSVVVVGFASESEARKAALGFDEVYHEDAPHRVFTGTLTEVLE